MAPNACISTQVLLFSSYQHCKNNKIILNFKKLLPLLFENTIQLCYERIIIITRNHQMRAFRQEYRNRESFLLLPDSLMEVRKDNIQFLPVLHAC